MKILAYLIAFALSFTVGSLASFVIDFLVELPIMYLFRNKKEFYKTKILFWESFISGGLECLLLISLSMWVFNWFGFHIPLLYVIILSLGFFQNNLVRLNKRPNYNLELGYLVSQLFGFIAIYLIFLKADLITFYFL